MERKEEDKGGGGPSIPLGTNDAAVGKLMNEKCAAGSNTREIELNHSYSQIYVMPCAKSICRSQVPHKRNLLTAK